MKINLRQGNKIKHITKNLLIRLIFKKYKSDLYNLISFIPLSKVLEINCREGLITKFLADKFENVNGGNTPGYIRRRGTREFKDFIEPYGEIVKFKGFTFWNFVLIKKKV